MSFIDSFKPENLQNLSGSSNVDEGYGDQSEFNVHSSSSETQVKTLFVPDTRLNERGSFPITTPQPEPVHITNRNQLPNARRQTPVPHRAVTNSNDSANIQRNVSLQMTLIAFLAYTKNPRNFVQMFSVGQ